MYLSDKSVTYLILTCKLTVLYLVNDVSQITGIPVQISGQWLKSCQHLVVMLIICMNLYVKLQYIWIIIITSDGVYICVSVLGGNLCNMRLDVKPGSMASKHHGCLIQSWRNEIVNHRSVSDYVWPVCRVQTLQKQPKNGAMRR